MKKYFTLSIFGLGLLGLSCSQGTGSGPNSGGGTGAGNSSSTDGTTGSGSTSSNGNGGGGGGSGNGAAPNSGGATGSGSTSSNGNGGGGAAPNSGGASGTGGNSDTGGSSGTGGNSGTGGGSADEPSLVTSGEGAYWQVGEVTEGASGPATITVDTNAEGQEWHGFGGTFNEQGWAAMGALTASEREAIMELLFDEENGIGMTWGRIPMGPSDYAVERYSLSSGPGNFDISHDREYLIPYVKAAQQWKDDIKFWGSPWTPPPWAKTGDTENNGYDKGLFDTAHYENYANYFVAWVDAYEQEGIPIDHVQPQNEPGWAQSYPTCAFGPARDSTNNTDIYQNETVSLGPFVEDYLKPALDATQYDTKIWFGTLSNDSTFEAYWNSLSDKSIVEGVALQWETQVRVSSLRQQGHLVMQSEHKCGNYPWLQEEVSTREEANRNNFLPTMAPNNHAYGEESWDLIKGWIDDGVNIYSAWNMVLDTGGFNLDEVRPWPQNAMIAVDTDAGTYEVTPYYYVFRHVAQYVDVGAKVVGIDTNGLAFQNPDGAVVAIVFNEGNSEATHTIDIGGTMLEFSVPGRGWATVNWQG